MVISQYIYIRTQKNRRGNSIEEFNSFEKTTLRLRSEAKEERPLYFFYSTCVASEF